MWYLPTKEDFYFITGLFKRRKDFPYFLNMLSNVVGESQLAFVHRYVSVDIIDPSNYHVYGVHLRLHFFRVK